MRQKLIQQIANQGKQFLEFIGDPLLDCLVNSVFRSSIDTK